jgi:hypothetical protein
MYIHALAPVMKMTGARYKSPPGTVLRLAICTALNGNDFIVSDAPFYHFYIQTRLS